MITRTVQCDRCGDVLEEERPHRITIHKPDVKVSTDHWGQKHAHKIYIVEQSIHLCESCRIMFNAFMNECKYKGD